MFKINSLLKSKINLFSMMNKLNRQFCSKIKFTDQHEWIKLDNDVVTVGISDHAQKELGEIVHVDLPKLGDALKQGDSMGGVESVKTASDIYSPVEGKVVEVNDKLKEKPKLLNEDPQNSGWFSKLKVNRTVALKTLEELMSEEQYNDFLKSKQ